MSRRLDCPSREDVAVRRCKALFNKALELTERRNVARLTRRRLSVGCPRQGPRGESDGLPLQLGIRRVLHVKRQLPSPCGRRDH